MSIAGGLLHVSDGILTGFLLALAALVAALAALFLVNHSRLGGRLADGRLLSSACHVFTSSQKKPHGRPACAGEAADRADKIGVLLILEAVLRHPADAVGHRHI